MLGEKGSDTVLMFSLVSARSPVYLQEIIPWFKMFLTYRQNCDFFVCDLLSVGWESKCAMFDSMKLNTKITTACMLHCHPAGPLYYCPLLSYLGLLPSNC